MNVFVINSVLVFILWLAVGDDNVLDIAGVLWIYNFVWMVSVIVNVSCLYLNLPTTSVETYVRFCDPCDRKAQEYGKQKIEELHNKIHSDYLRMTDSNPNGV